MNENTETNPNEITPGADSEQADTTTKASVSAADAATDLSVRLSPYEAWQAKYSEHLMDGTFSMASYIRLASNDGIEYGLQPRLQPHGDHLHIAGRLRVAHVVRGIADGGEQVHNEATGIDDADAKVEALYAYAGGFKDWMNHSPRRVSKIVNFTLPINVHEAGSLEQFLAVIDAGLWEKMIATFPTPAAGWDWSELRRAKGMFLEYLQLSINQFGIFNTVTVVENLWTDETTAAGELSEKLVAYMASFDAPQEGEAEASDTD